MLLKNIPLILLCFGTDSRVGFGFRLGPNADFQVMVELGPQENTMPLGAGGSGKRETYNEEEYKQWEEKLEDTGPLPQLDQDIVNHLRQLYKPQSKRKQVQSR